MRHQNRTRRDGEAECGARTAADAERAIAELAAKQCGVISARQLHAFGFDGRAILRRLRAGRLHRVHRGIYRVGYDAAVDGSVEMAAVLACGAGSVVSHRSAGRLWAVSSLKSWRMPVEITVPGRDPGRKPGIRVHRVRRLDSRDVRTVLGVPVTSPARTLLDLAAILPLAQVESLLEELRARGLMRAREITVQLERSRGQHGAAALRRILELERGPALTRSEAERRLIALLDAAALPAPAVNARVGRFEVDFLWRRERLIVEVDGYAYHSGKHAFERDHERDAVLVAGDHAVIRITWRQLVEKREAVIARIAAALAVRSSR